MGTSIEPVRHRPEYETTGAEPEFFVTELLREEPAADGCLRLYFGQSRGGKLVLEFTVVITAADLAKIAKRNLHNAVEARNQAMWSFGTEGEA